MTIETPRLLLRPITENDANDIFDYSRSPNVGPNAGWKPHESLEESVEVIRLIFLGQEGVFGIVLRETGRLVGTVGLIDDPKRENPGARMLGYALGESYWGMGYMTEAARALIEYGFSREDLSLISVYCYPHNFRSKRVIEKCGFRYEGRLKQCERLYDGRVLDNECYVLLREEYHRGSF